MEPHWCPTDSQHNLLRRTWQGDFDFLYELGADIYEVIFTRSPHAMELFPLVAQHGDNWKDNKQFREQALKFVQVLDQAVKNIQRPEALKPMLRGIGRTHKSYVERGFKPDFWLLFQEAIEVAMSNHIDKHLKEVLSLQEKRDAVGAWKQLATFLVDQMRLGFDENFS